MAKEITEFEEKRTFDIPSYFVLQSSSRQTNKTEFSNLFYNICMSSYINIISIDGVNCIRNNIYWFIENSSPAYDLKIKNGPGIRVVNDGLRFFVDNINLSTSLRLTSGHGILVNKIENNVWKIENCLRAYMIKEPILVAGRSIEIEKVGRHKWKVHYRPKTITEEPVNKFSRQI